MDPIHTVSKKPYFLIPKYAVIPLVIALTYNCVGYWGTKWISSGKEHFYLGFDFEDKITFMPWMVTVYLGCYAFWIINYALSIRQSEQKAYQFLIAEIMGKTVCFIFYIFLPTKMERPVIESNTLLETILAFVYKVDSADNLFPSIHCLISWLCFIGVRRNSKIPVWYRIISCIIAILICISTLTVKQHVFVDTIAGIFVAEICYFISGRFVNKTREKSRKISEQK